MKIKVLHLNASTGFAGAERVLLNYLTSHDKEVFSIQVASYVNFQRPDNSFTELMEEQGIPFHKILIGSASFSKVVSETVKLIREEGIDLVHSHGYRSDISGYLAARIARVPILTTVHGWTPISWKLRLYEQLDRWVLRRFDGIIAVSNEIVKTLTASGVLPTKIRMINNAIPDADAADKAQSVDAPALFQSGPIEQIILSVGRLSHEKGYDILLRSFHKYCAPDNKIGLVIVGDGPLRAELETLARNLDISERVIFTGFMNDIRIFYKVSDLFVLPSRTEGLPMVVLEAMQSGMPVVCTRVGGIPEVIVNGQNGMLVESESIDSLGEAMLKMLKDRTLAGSMANAGMATIADRFTADKWALQIEKFYLELMDSK